MPESLAKLRDREAAIFEGETYDEPNDAYSFKRGFDKCYSLMVDDLTAANAKLEKLKDALGKIFGVCAPIANRTWNDVLQSDKDDAIGAVHVACAIANDALAEGEGS